MIRKERTAAIVAKIMNCPVQSVPPHLVIYKKRRKTETIEWIDIKHLAIAASELTEKLEGTFSVIRTLSDHCDQQAWEHSAYKDAHRHNEPSFLAKALIQAVNKRALPVPMKQQFWEKLNDIAYRGGKPKRKRIKR